MLISNSRVSFVSRVRTETQGRRGALLENSEEWLRDVCDDRTSFTIVSEFGSWTRRTYRSRR